MKKLYELKEYPYETYRYMTLKEASERYSGKNFDSPNPLEVVTYNDDLYSKYTNISGELLTFSEWLDYYHIHIL